MSSAFSNNYFTVRKAEGYLNLSLRIKRQEDGESTETYHRSALVLVSTSASRISRVKCTKFMSKRSVF